MGCMRYGERLVLMIWNPRWISKWSGIQDGYPSVHEGCSDPDMSDMVQHVGTSESKTSKTKTLIS